MVFVGLQNQPCPLLVFLLALRFWEGTAFSVSLAFTRRYNLVTVAVHQKPPNWS